MIKLPTPSPKIALGGHSVTPPTPPLPLHPSYYTYHATLFYKYFTDVNLEFDEFRVHTPISLIRLHPSLIPSANKTQFQLKADWLVEGPREIRRKADSLVEGERRLSAKKLIG